MTEVYCKDCANRLRGRIDTLKTVYRGNICWEAMRRAEFDSMFLGSFEMKFGCEECRKLGGMCGPDGRLFKPKNKPWWRFWS